MVLTVRYPFNTKEKRLLKYLVFSTLVGIGSGTELAMGLDPKGNNVYDWFDIFIYIMNELF